ncbi:MAG: glycosyltransferase family 2 protein [Pseudomonadota bacterium]
MFYAPHTMEGSARWAVTCTCREPTQLVMAYVGHYVALGASEVRLYLDQPQPDLQALLDQVPQVITTLCDDAYWAASSAKARPKAIEYRQLINAFDAYHATQADWLGHFDADEFLHADVPVGDILAAQPQELEFAVIEPRERAFVEGVAQAQLFDGVFRQPIPHLWGKAAFLFGKAGRFLRQGVLAYPHGKSFMRTGRPLVPGIHTPRRPGTHRRLKLRGHVAFRTRLLHFDGLTALHWSGKLLRAAAAGGEKHFQTEKSRDVHRAKQIIRMRRRGANLPNAFDMHQMLKVVPADQLERLRILSVIEDYAIDPARDVAALGLDYRLDLSRAGFDKALGDQMPQVADWLEEWEAILAGAHPSNGAPNRQAS